MAFYLIGSYINSIDDSTMQQLNAMSDPAANIYQDCHMHSISAHYISVHQKFINKQQPC